MKKFIIFFEEKEGTSALVRLLSHFDRIAIVHQTGNTGWEPFDLHNCGAISLESFVQCLELIFNKEPLDIERLNRIYTQTAKSSLEAFNKNNAVGFKIRFKTRPFMKALFELVKKNEVVVFMAIRQDILRWALSKYHGDGTGRKGHLQFKLAKGEIRKEQIGKIYVDCQQLKKIISMCEKSHARKRNLRRALRQKGIEVYQLRYEDFLTDKLEYFRRICKILGITISSDEINSALSKGTYFEKVHSDQIADFVENHQEVMERFGDYLV
jgi:hypothetical protein